MQPESAISLRTGIVERVTDYSVALREVFDGLTAAGISTDDLVAVGHREWCTRCAFLPTDGHRRHPARGAEKLSPLAPLHNPPALLGTPKPANCSGPAAAVGVRHRLLHDLPAAAAEYAIDRDVARQWHIRR